MLNAWLVEFCDLLRTLFVSQVCNYLETDSTEEISRSLRFQKLGIGKLLNGQTPDSYKFIFVFSNNDEEKSVDFSWNWIVGVEGKHAGY